MIRHIAQAILRISGWRLVARLPAEEKYLIIGAPHTSNWDFPMALLALSALGLRFSWIGKHTMFYFPFGLLFRALGGIPVDRHTRQDFVKQMVARFTSVPSFVLAMTPEGTRARTSYWKTGFYAIAVEAAVPVALGFIDYKNKEIGVGSSFSPSGDIAGDLAILQRFYQDKTGKYPEKQGPVQFHQKDLLRLSKKDADLGG